MPRKIIGPLPIWIINQVPVRSVCCSKIMSVRPLRAIQIIHCYDSSYACICVLMSEGLKLWKAVLEPDTFVARIIQKSSRRMYWRFASPLALARERCCGLFLISNVFGPGTILVLNNRLYALSNRLRNT